MKIQIVQTNAVIPYARNPRKNDAAVDKVVASLQEFGWQQPIVVDKKHVVIAGHTRLLAAKRLGMGQVPIHVAKDLTPEQAKAYRLADNRTAEEAEWDMELLGLEIRELDDLDFDLDLTGFNNLELSGLLIDPELVPGAADHEREEIPIELYGPAWAQWAGETADQIDALTLLGSSFSCITEGAAKIHFLQAKYYNTDYPRFCSLAFHNKQIHTKGHGHSVMEGLRKTSNSDWPSGNSEYQSLAFVTGEQPSASKLYAGSLPFRSARMPLDFPASLARNMIDRFCPNGRILDPCHGYGGRLVGFLLSSAIEYVGVDVSPYQSEGCEKIRDAFLPLAGHDKSVTLICDPYEDAEIEGEFDFAVTSPPYFNVEKYLGGKQSYEAGNYVAWRDGFYTTLIHKTYKALKVGATFCLQVGSQRYPLIEDGKRIAMEAGFSYIGKEDTGIVNHYVSWGNTRETAEDRGEGESILILRKNKEADLTIHKVVKNSLVIDRVPSSQAILLHSEAITALTPVQKEERYRAVTKPRPPCEFETQRWKKAKDLYYKRDDLFRPFGEHNVNGGKVRQCLALIAERYDDIKNNHHGTLITQSSVDSPQGTIVANIARELGLRCIVCVGGAKPETLYKHTQMNLVRHYGAEIRIVAGHGMTVVINARINEINEKENWFNIGFGMNVETSYAALIDTTAKQVENIPDDLDYLVISVGSGLQIAGILKGVAEHGKRIGKIIGVQVGPSRRKKIDGLFRSPQEYDLIDSFMPYSRYVVEYINDEETLDPIYESKAHYWMRRNLDMTKRICFWNIGRRLDEIPFAP